MRNINTKTDWNIPTLSAWVEEAQKELETLTAKKKAATKILKGIEGYSKMYPELDFGVEKFTFNQEVEKTADEIRHLCSMMKTVRGAIDTLTELEALTNNEKEG